MKFFKITIALLVLLSNSALSSPFSKYAIQITGANPAWEGNLCKYTVSGIPANASFATPVVVNGVVTTSNLNPASGEPRTVTVLWNCQVPQGSITVTELLSNTSYTYTVDILTYGTFSNFCNQPIPVAQNLLYGVTPQSLIITDCSPYCTSSYGFTYQWQKSTGIDNGFDPAIVTGWEDINGATGIAYQPSAMLNYGTVAYRRITSFIRNGQTIQIPSIPSWVSFDTYLTAGSIATPTTVINNILPVVTQTPATGGLCTPNNYSYTWESSIAGGPWQVIGTGESYPTTAPYIYGEVQIRRKVICQTEIQYSNTISLSFIQAPFTAGTISYPSLNLTNTMYPSIDQVPASGSLCPTGTYGYEWERSVDGHPWQIIGTGATYPATAPPITVATAIRRKAICQSETAYSNTLYFTIDNANYFPPVSDNLNYIREIIITRPGIVFRPQVEDLPVEEKHQSTTYFDETGRLIQTVTKAASPLKKDMASINEYDNMGREAKKYLPFVSSVVQIGDVDNDGRFKTSAFQQLQNFNQQQYGAQGETFFYGLTEFEASPLGRPLKTFAPGNSWVGSRGTGSEKAIQQQYLTNTTTDGVIIWEIAAANGSLPQSTGLYQPGQLVKSISIDEHNKAVVEYKDKSDRIILKKVQLAPTAGDGHSGWLCTYYIYNELGRLSFVMPPLAVEKYLEGAPIATLGDELCFSYVYDSRGRNITKKVPGAAVTNMIYDVRDRLVMLQDGNLQSQGKWQVLQYDALNRPAKTLLWENSNDAVYHRQQASQSITYPSISGNSELLSETYYDNYDWVAGTGTLLTATADASQFNNSSYFITSTDVAPLYAREMKATNFVRGLATGSRTKVLGTPNQYLYTASFFDDKGSVLQTQQINSSGGKDINTNQYDFTGKLLRSVEQHQKAAPNSTNVTIASKLTYDHKGRLLTIKKSITSNVNGTIVNSPEKTVAQHQYDELGQLKRKELGVANGGSNPLETLDYDYNIRGWLTGINKNYLNNNATGNWFGMELAYDKTTSIAGFNYATSQYNGNISGTAWKQKGDEVKRRYDYGYDNVNRLLKADFAQDETNSNTWTANTMNYNIKMGDGSTPTSAYDANGNIKQMQQWGWKFGGSNQIDNLAYQYGTPGNPNSNKLTKVSESASGTTPTGISPGLGDFKDGTNTGDDYSYDANGNLVLDNNKNIQAIQYNHLNLPQLITIAPVQAGQAASTIAYTYDANGNKLKKLVTDNTISPTKVTITDYISGFVYKNDQLQFAGHEEGRLRYVQQYYLNGTNAWTWQYDYFIKDHLGNVRTVLTEQQDIAKYMATFETANLTLENELFTNITNTRYNRSTIANPSYPNDPTTNPNNFVSKLDGVNKQLGATLALKVMAGDKVDLGVKAWVPNSGDVYAPDPRGSTATTPILSGLSNALTTGASNLSGGKVTSTELNTVGSPLLAGITTFLNHHPAASPTDPPKAYLNWILFDEQFNYVPAGSNFIRVGNPDDNLLQTLSRTDLSIVKSGYLFVYLSNEGDANGNSKLVFFDNFVVQHTTGPLTAETPYYPFGVAMAGISSNGLNIGGNDTNCNCPNKKGFNGNDLESEEFNNGSGLNLYDFNSRTYDQQIGRFIQIDPLTEDEKQDNLSSYQFGWNNPIRYNDPDGKCPGCVGFLKMVHALGVERAKQVFRNVQQYNAKPDVSIRKTGGGNYQSGNFTVTNHATGRTVTLTESRPLINNPRVTVESKQSSNGLQVIQVVNGSPLPTSSGIQQMIIGGQQRTAFVDGGTNSPIVAAPPKGEGGPRTFGQPYYNSSITLADRNYANATWDNNSLMKSGSITAFDVPTAAAIHSNLKFETYFVLTNYANSGSDKIVGVVKWGYTTNGSGTITPIGTPTVTATNKFSTTAAAIIRNDYPMYKTTQ